MSDIVKIIFDRVVAAVAIIVLSPLLILLYLAVWWKMGRPAIFSQIRPGRHGKLFTIYKFRTMKNLSDEDGRPLPDDKRLTRLGSILRSSSLDELPELFNVLKGDMSLVGPRPLLRSYLSRYTPEQARRHEVLPGITGWAQVNGRNAISWDDKFALDTWYVDHHGFWLDLKILARTVKKVFERDGIAANGHATMPEFMGSGAVVEIGDVVYCEKCGVKLDPDEDAFACSHECTFCGDCAAQLEYGCPNCGGLLCSRKSSIAR